MWSKYEMQNVWLGVILCVNSFTVNIWLCVFGLNGRIFIELIWPFCTLTLPGMLYVICHAQCFSDLVSGLVVQPNKKYSKISQIGIEKWRIKKIRLIWALQGMITFCLIMTVSLRQMIVYQFKKIFYSTRKNYKFERVLGRW